ncbi:MAG: restriction endonuclease subunit S [Saprospiraceae bacterium]
MEQLEKYFDTAFGAPYGVNTLRQLILRLALRGKLVPQDIREGTAKITLKNILPKTKKIAAKTKNIESSMQFENNHDEAPYELPKSWEWVRLNQVLQTTSGLTFPANLEKQQGRIPYLKVGDMNLPGNEIIITTSSRFIDPEKKHLQYLISPGSIIFPKRGGAIATNKKRIVDSPIFVDLNTMAISPSDAISTQYSYYWLSSIDLATLNTGTSVPQINHKDIDPLLLPLPPIKEQDRIVNKIAELMSRCDELEKLRAERDQKRLAMHTAAIRKMLDAPDQETFDDAWQFITRHFGELYTVRENVAELRKAILQLAVMGKLVKPKSIVSYIKLKELTTKIGSGSTPSGGKNTYHKSGTPLIRSMNVHFGGFAYDGLAFINEAQAKKLNNVIVQTNDVFLNITGASIGRVAIAPLEMNGARVNQHVCILRTKDNLIPQFLEIFLSSPLIQNWIQDIQVGATREALTKVKIEQIIIPIPSVADQTKMIEKAKILLGLCDDLEQQIDLMQEKQGEVLGAFITDEVQIEGGSTAKGKRLPRSY